MKYDKLYGFYNSNTSSSQYLDVRFDEIASNSLPIECIKVDENSNQATLWGVTTFPTLILSKNGLRGPIVHGAQPGYVILEWLNQNGIMGDNNN